MEWRVRRLNGCTLAQYDEEKRAARAREVWWRPPPT